MSQFPQARFLLSVASADQFPAEPGREVAFAGRSNAGKSSAINAIVQRNGLARTSKTPGRTKLLNFFELESGLRLIDLPGYGYAEASPAERAQWTRLVEALPGRENLVGLFLIIDIRRGITAQDEQLLAWSEAAGWQVHVLLTKSDKLTQKERAAALKAAQAQLAHGMTAQIFSSHDRTGVKEAQTRLRTMLGS